MVDWSDDNPPIANTPAALRWWAQRCANFGGLQRAFNEAADALEAQLAYARHERDIGAERVLLKKRSR